MTTRKARRVQVARKTKETDIRLGLNLDGSGIHTVSVGLPFFEHMLGLWSAHSLMDLQLKARGDLDVDQHHVVEDVGLVLGQALARALGDKRGIRRYGWSIVPMDEALIQVAVDLSGRPYTACKLVLRQKRLGGFDTELVLEFFRALANAAGMTLHITQLAGGNTHHSVEAAFKGFGQALRQAVEPDARRRGVPSTKGKL